MQEQKLKELNEEILKNPYNTIKDWAEERLKLTGEKVFQFSALQPISLIAPDIPAGDYSIRTNIHLLLIAPSGSGKSTALRMQKDITYNPFKFKDITGARAIEELSGKNNVSMICDDVETMFKDMDLIKIMEGALGEEKEISRHTMRSSRQLDINSTFIGGCLPYSLKKNIKQGLIQRMIPIVLFHSKNEQMEIGKHISSSIFSNNSKISRMDIADYYQKIYNIQKGRDEQNKKIDGYVVSEEQKKVFQKLWVKIFDLNFPEDSYFNRELHSPFRYLCCSAMLNYFNREIVVENGKSLIIPNDQDLQLSKKLFKIEMIMKYHIMRLDSLVDDAKGKDVLRLYEQIQDSGDLAYEVKQIGKIFLDSKLKQRIN